MNQIKKWTASWLIAAVLCAACAMTAFARPDWPSDTGIMAESGIVMDKNSGAVIFGQNIHVAYPPASITKLLTALVVIENADLDDTVTFSYDAVYNVESGSGNKCNIEEGDQLSVRDCLYLLLLQSSNQAANALAEHVSGSREGFVELMNQRIAQLGCTESHFANPSGLNDDQQYVTAYDMALISQAAFSNETLMEIDSATSYTIPPTINNPNGVTFEMEHRIIRSQDSSSQYYCEGALAGKTGYTSLAGNTLVTLAERDGRELIAVVLKGTQPQYYLDSVTLLDFAFDRFKNESIPENETSYTTGSQPVEINGVSYEPSDLYLEEGTMITLPADAQFSDADKTLTTDLGEDHPDGAVALVQYSYNDRQIGQAWLFSRTAVQAALIQQQAQETDSEASPVQPSQGESTPQEAQGGLNPAVAAGIAGVVVVAAAAAGTVFYIRRSRQKEQEDLARRRARRLERLKESGMSEEEFERLRQERFGDKPGSRRGRKS